MYHKYISQIKSENLEKFMVSLNRIAIATGLEDIKKLRQDSTVVETNIHYPTNNSLVWDCIKESHRLLNHLQSELSDLTYINYLKGAKRTYFKINVSSKADLRKELFAKQLILFTKTINSVANIIKKKPICNTLRVSALDLALEELVLLMQKVFWMTIRREIEGKKVENCDKVFSIYEQHTDIIVKGSREVIFGHKLNLSTGSGRLIFSWSIEKGNPNDSNLFEETIDSVVNNYKIIPRDTVTDGGYGSLKNMEYAVNKGIKNVVFAKIVGSLKNKVSSRNLKYRLKKCRSGMELVISNLKRGFNISRITWKGKAHFKAKVFWAVIAYNIRVMKGVHGSA